MILPEAVYHIEKLYTLKLDDDLLNKQWKKERLMMTLFQLSILQFQSVHSHTRILRHYNYVQHHSCGFQQNI